MITIKELVENLKEYSKEFGKDTPVLIENMGIICREVEFEIIDNRLIITPFNLETFDEYEE